jgi:hypothetical protein
VNEHTPNLKLVRTIHDHLIMEQWGWLQRHGTSTT